MIDKRTFLPCLAVLAGLILNLPLCAQYSTPMHDVDAGARQPVNFQVIIGVCTGCNQGSDTTTVTIPAGKRLVIETISGLAIVTIGETGYLQVQVTAGAGTPAGATQAMHTIPMVKLTGNPFFDYLGCNASLRVYADAGSTVGLFYNRGPVVGSGAVRVAVTGSYVNLP